MRHDPTYVSRIRYSAECQACIGWIAHPNSFASKVSGSSGGDLEIAFSGECFNTSVSTSRSDDLLDAYRQCGSSFVRDLNGMFSGVLLDSNARRALLFVDRYASERIYYHQVDGLLYFASEAKALLAILPRLRAFDPDGVADFLAFGSCRGTRTLFRGVSRLPGASLLEFDTGQVAERRTYFSPSEWENLEPLTEDQFESAFVETARHVVPRYARGESAIGFSITGGLDTRMILACLSGELSNLVCYTYGAGSGETLDVSIGRKIARHLGCSHQTLRVDDQFVSEFQTYLDRSIYISDGCASALSAHELFFSEKARSISPVRLTGNFGSEILRNVSTMKPLSFKEGLIDNEFKSRVNESINARRQAHPLTRTAFDEIPSHLFGPLSTARSQLLFRTPFLDDALVKLAYQAPSSSRNTPDAALRLIASGHGQLGRTPTDLGFSCGRQTPMDAARRLFCRITFKLDYWDKEGLPPSLSLLDTCRPLLQRVRLLGLHKFLPYRRWFKKELFEVIASATRRADCGDQPWWNEKVITQIGTEHASGRKNHLREINAILTLDAVQRVLIDGIPGQLPADGSGQDC